MGGAIGALASNPWTLPVGLGLGIFGNLFANRQKTLPPPSPMFPGINSSYLGSLSGGPGVMGLGPASMGGLTSMIQGGGMPTNFMPNVEAITAAMGRQQGQARANLKESYGSKGLRFSTPMLNAAVDLESQIAKDYGSILSNFAFQTQENAAQRALQAMGIGSGLFSGAGTAMYQSKTPPGGGAVAGIASGVGDVFQTISLMRMMGLM